MSSSNPLHLSRYGAIPTAHSGRLPYLPGLDGLRAIAVTAVMIYHANHNWLQGGYLGVEIFFVISGYLITLLLVNEHERSGTVNLRQFWLRRFRRLLPALYLLLTMVAVYVTAVYTSRREEIRGDFGAAIAYVSNWYQVLVGQGYGSGEKFVPLRHLWSLAVEEQFYLLWPLVILLLLRRRRKNLRSVGLRLIAASVLISVAVAALYVPGATAGTCDVEGFRNGWATVLGKCINVNEALYLGSFSRAGGLLLGAGFAMLWRPRPVGRGTLVNQGGRLDVLAALGLAILVYLSASMWLFEQQVYNQWLFRGGFLLVGVATLFVIAAAAHPHSATGAALGNKLFLWVGTRSYGLYLFHWPIYQVIRKQANIQLSLGQFLLALAITIPITEASYRLVEVPIRKGALSGAMARLRDPRRLMAVVSVTGMLVVATVSLYSAQAQCVGDVQKSLCDNVSGAAQTLPPPDSTDGGASSTVTGGETTVAAVTTTIPLPDPYQFVAIGESVMAGADSELKAAGMWVDTMEARSADGVKGIVVGLRRGNIIGEGTTLIIQVGTNSPMNLAAIDAIMAEVPDTVNRVVFLTLYAPPAWIPDNNELIRSLPGIYPIIDVLDWAVAAPGLPLCPDGIHLTCGDGSAAIAYANMIFADVGLPAI